MNDDSCMFRELTDPSPDLVQILASFDEMLALAHQLVERACGVAFGCEPIDESRSRVFDMENRIDDLERSIRRRLSVHAIAYGTNEVPICLGMMSIVKDAERIGDYGNGLFRLAERLVSPLDGAKLADAKRTAEQVAEVLEKGRFAIQGRDAESAREVIRMCSHLREHCDEIVDELLTCPASEREAVAFALIFRQLDRICSHMLNIQTSLVQPIERLDFMP
jgi:phosphate uptake regulator